MTRSKFAPVLLFACAVALGGLLALQRDRIPDAFSLASDVPFANLSKAARAPDGSLAVVFDSNKRIAKIDPSGQLAFSLSPRNDPESGFYFANEVAFGPDGELFVASTYIDPAKVAVDREAIVRFSPLGKLETVLYRIEHSTDVYTDNIGLVRSLQWTPDGLRFCVARDDGVQALLVDPSSGHVLDDVLVPFPGARSGVIYASVAADGGEIAFTTAATEIFSAAPGQPPTKRYDGRDLPDEDFSIPADVHYLDRSIHFSDLGRDAVVRLEPDGSCVPVFDESIARSRGYEDDFFECKSFQIDENCIVLPNNGKVVQLDLSGNAPASLLSQARGNETLWIRRALLWLQMAAFVSSLLALASIVVRHSPPEGRRAAKQLALVALMVGTAVGITIYMIFNNMNRRLEEESAKNLRGYLEVGSIVVDADAVDRIRHVRHYMNDDYKAVLEQLNKTITRDGSIEPGTYSGVYKVLDGKLAALAYHDGLRGIFYPYDYQYEQSVYAKVAQTGEPYVGEMVDIYGIWLNGVVPLRNSAGDLVGFLEVGVDQSSQREANRTLFRQTLVDLGMVLFVLLFVFSEIGFFSSHVLDPVAQQDDPTRRLYDEGSLRFVSFLALSGVFLSASFLPIFSKSLAPPLGRLPVDVVAGLPMVVETLCGAVVALLYGHVRDRFGIKTDVVLACLAVAGGMVATSMAASFQMLLAGRVVVGMGMGLLMIAFRMFFLTESDAGRKESGIIALTSGVVAGINAGSVSGGMLAARIGMSSVFLVQAALLGLAALAALVLLRNRRRIKPAKSSSSLSPLAFFFDRSVWSFFLFAFLPVTACGLFLGFLFPLFAESRGASTNEISLAFMLFGVGSVYLGPSLTRLSSFLFGSRRAIAAGALAMACALLAFAYFRSLSAAYAAVVVFGLTESFVFNQGMAFFSSLRSVRLFGEDKAMGVYNLFESAGEALGPVAFGVAMGFSLGAGIAAIAAALGACAALFLAVGRPSGESSP